MEIFWSKEMCIEGVINKINREMENVKGVDIFF